MKQEIENAQKVALPAYLRKGLDAFRVNEGAKKKYLLRASWNRKTYELEPWQFFILEVLPVCDDYAKLASVFEDRFGHLITKNEVQELFSLMADKKLFGLAAISNPMLASFEATRKTPIGVESPQAAPINTKAHKNTLRARAVALEPQGLPAAANHTVSKDFFDIIGPLGGKAQGHLAKAMQLAQQSASSNRRRTTPHVEKPPAEASSAAQAGRSNRLVEVRSPESHTDSPAAESTKSNRNAESTPHVAKPPAAASSAAQAGRSNHRVEVTSPEPHADTPAAESTKSNRNAESKRAVETIDKPIPAGVRDAVGLDATLRKQGWKLFNPIWLIKLIHPLLLPFKYTIYLIPLLLIAAVFVSYHHAGIIEKNLTRLFGDASFIEHALLGMVTVNLSVTLVTALVAHSYRATVSAFCIVFLMGFFPRFMVRIGHVQQLSRRERIWLHAAPLVMRLALFSVGILMWFGTRMTHAVLADVGLWVALVATISFFITLNPLVKSSGYHLIAAYLNEPHLRGKSYKALLNKFRGDVYRKSDNNALVAFALASTLYTVAIIAALLYIFGRYLDIEFGRSSLLVIVFISLVLGWRMIKKFKETERAVERSTQFERWRNRTFPQIEDDTTEKKRSNTTLLFLRRSMLLLFVAVLFLPYTYEPGGNFIVLPNEQQEISAEVPGIVEKINYDGGEILKKETVIGQLSYSDYESQVKVYAAKIKQQQAVINELKARPIPEELKLAKSALKTKKTQAEFSKAKATRYEQLYKEGVISFEDLDDARRQYEVDFDQVQEKTANLELVKSGATPDEIAEAEAKLQSYQVEYDHNQKKIEESILYMPFDGKLITLHLKQRIGSYLNKGEPLAVAEQTHQVKAEIEIPETDISYVKENSEIQFRFQVYHDESFYGVVKIIDANVKEEQHGKVIKVVALLENKNERLKSGMTGYAKISGEKMPIWKVFSLAILRFLKVEVWSWLP